MLKKKDLIDVLGKEYENMINKISISDFTKCIAQYSGISIENLKDDMIKEYLTLWAKNKKHIFDFFGGKTQVDLTISYINEENDYEDKIMEIAQKYPAYYLWLEMFKSTSNNKITEGILSYSERNIIKKLFPDFRIEGATLTRFLKSKIDAPDELVTAIGRIWENNQVNANFTLSIDPTDIMTSSENPYNWTSCYRLENDSFNDSHADGCLAGVLDNSTIITYIWENHGKLDLYRTFTLKDIRYKRIRMTIGTNKEHTAIIFNQVYPGKSSYSESFVKLLRDKVETYFANQLQVENLWARNVKWLIKGDRIYCEYGYDEYSNDDIYYLKKKCPEYTDNENHTKLKNCSDIETYGTIIHCPCGCGESYHGSSFDDDNLEFDGCGHVNENYYTRDNYCEEIDEYIDCDGDCEHCRIYNEHNLVCSLDENETCDFLSPDQIEDLEYEGEFNLDETNIVPCTHNCEGCPLYAQHHQQENQEEETEEQTQTGFSFMRWFH